MRVSNKLADFEQAVDRWHVDTEKVTEAVEAAEGVDAVETGVDRAKTSLLDAFRAIGFRTSST